MIIGIIGNKRTGKDTIGDYLIDEHNFNKFKIATPIKKIVEKLFDINQKQIENEKEIIDNRWGMSPRYLLCMIGTEIFRTKDKNVDPENLKIIKTQFIKHKNYVSEITNIDEKVIENDLFDNWCDDNIWIDILCNNCKNNSDKNIVICDVRDPIEVEQLSNMGCHFIMVDRNKIETMDYSHVTERGIDVIRNNIDKYNIEYIYNDGTFEELYENIDNIMSMFQKTSS